MHVVLNEGAGCQHVFIHEGATGIHGHPVPRASGPANAAKKVGPLAGVAGKGNAPARGNRREFRNSHTRFYANSDQE